LQYTKFISIAKPPLHQVIEVCHFETNTLLITTDYQRFVFFYGQNSSTGG